MALTSPYLLPPLATDFWLLTELSIYGEKMQTGTVSRLYENQQGVRMPVLWAPPPHSGAVFGQMTTPPHTHGGR